MVDKKLSINIDVLVKCKILIKTLKLFNFHELNTISFNKYIIFFIALMTSVVFVMGSLLWFLLERGFVLSEVSYAIPIFIGCSQILLESFPLIIKTKRINDTVNRLQSVVKTRKFPLNQIFCIVIFKIFVDVIFQDVRNHWMQTKFMKNVNRQIYSSQQFCLEA